MSSQFAQVAMSIMGSGEFLLSALLGFVFWKRGYQRRFPAMGTYLALRVISTPILSLLLMAQAQPWGQKYFLVYFVLFYMVYIASAVNVYFICLEVFRSALASLPGLLKFGLVIFRWAVLVSVIVTFATLPIANRGLYLIPDIGVALMRSVSLLELCLLAFLCLSMNALRLSVRDLAFGLALGLGVMSSNDFIFSLLTPPRATLISPLQFVYESVILFPLRLGLYIAHCLNRRVSRWSMPSEFDDLSMERDCLGTWPHRDAGGSAAACQQLFPHRCGERR